MGSAFTRWTLHTKFFSERKYRGGVRGKEIVQRLVAGGRLEDDWKRSHALDVLCCLLLREKMASRREDTEGGVRRREIVQGSAADRMAGGWREALVRRWTLLLAASRI